MKYNKYCLKMGNVSNKISSHYLNIRNHIYFIKKHNLDFNLIGVWIYQFFKIFSYLLYFTIKLRFVKLKMVYKGFIDGLNYKKE